MSLDVYLYAPREPDEPTEEPCTCKECWTVHSRPIPRRRLYNANITHNLNEMAARAGIYTALWRPEELIDGQPEITASVLVRFLESGLADMRARPEVYKEYNAKNGWGTYDDFVPWIEKLITACKQYPDAIVEASR